MNETYVTVKQAADYLHVSYRTVQRYLSDGKIPYLKPGGKILIKEKDLTDFVLMVR